MYSAFFDPAKISFLIVLNIAQLSVGHARLTKPLDYIPLRCFAGSQVNDSGSGSGLGVGWECKNDTEDPRRATMSNALAPQSQPTIEPLETAGSRGQHSAQAPGSIISVYNPRMQSLAWGREATEMISMWGDQATFFTQALPVESHQTHFLWKTPMQDQQRYESWGSAESLLDIDRGSETREPVLIDFLARLDQNRETQLSLAIPEPQFQPNEDNRAVNKPQGTTQLESLKPGSKGIAWEEGHIGVVGSHHWVNHIAQPDFQPNPRTYCSLQEGLPADLTYRSDARAFQTHLSQQPTEGLGLVSITAEKEKSPRSSKKKERYRSEKASQDVHQRTRQKKRMQTLKKVLAEESRSDARTVKVRKNKQYVPFRELLKLRKGNALSKGGFRTFIEQDSQIFKIPFFQKVYESKEKSENPMPLNFYNFLNSICSETGVQQLKIAELKVCEVIDKGLNTRNNRQFIASDKKQFQRNRDRRRARFTTIRDALWSLPVVRWILTETILERLEGFLNGIEVMIVEITTEESIRRALSRKMQEMLARFLLVCKIINMFIVDDAGYHVEMIVQQQNEAWTVFTQFWLHLLEKERENLKKLFLEGTGDKEKVNSGPHHVFFHDLHIMAHKLKNDLQTKYTTSLTWELISLYIMKHRPSLYQRFLVVTGEFYSKFQYFINELTATISEELPKLL